MFVLRTYKKKALVVGLAIKRRRNSNNPVVTLCIGFDCLVIQTLHAALPPKLFSFLADPGHIFVGFGVEEDAKKLRKDYNLVVECVVDLRDLEPLRLKFLVSKVVCIELEMEKSWRVTLEDCEKLSIKQVENACIDAYVSREIGRIVRAEWHCGFQQIKNLKEQLFAIFKPKTMRDHLKKEQ